MSSLSSRAFWPAGSAFLNSFWCFQISCRSSWRSLVARILLPGQALMQVWIAAANFGHSISLRLASRRFGIQLQLASSSKTLFSKGSPDSFLPQRRVKEVKVLLFLVAHDHDADRIATPRLHAVGKITGVMHRLIIDLYDYVSCAEAGFLCAAALFYRRAPAPRCHSSPRKIHRVAE